MSLQRKKTLKKKDGQEIQSCNFISSQKFITWALLQFYLKKMCNIIMDKANERIREALIETSKIFISNNCAYLKKCKKQSMYL